MNKPPLVGISMREVRDPAGTESRDALAQDWAVFFQAADLPWLMLPNLEEAAPAYAQEHHVTALVLSGGDDVGASPKRDRTEAALLAWAEAKKLPVLGVCRGMQMLAQYFGLPARPLETALHVRARHNVLPATAPGAAADAVADPRQAARLLFDGHAGREVNSYHSRGLLLSDLLPVQACTAPAPRLLPAAYCPTDNSLEAFCVRGLPWWGIMWHPEREQSANPADVRLLHHLLCP